ncbi:MAG TPA: HAD family hydrolase [Thermodesulfobacteriota bacterium]|nr:HAD family hydrolase [Thermodesulfobacteriota bacterium]
MSTKTGKTKKAFFFDFGDTLASTDPPFIFRIAMAMRKSGFDITDSEFEAEYVKADYRLFLKHKEMGRISPREHREWFFPILYESLAPIADIESFRESVRSEMNEIGFSRSPIPGAAELLDFLKGKGYLLAVISNNDGYTEEKCEEVGIRRYLDFVFDSTKLDMVKPDRRIFKYAAEKMGISPSDAVHIGDMYGTDVMGALNAGSDVIWFNGRKMRKFDDTEVKEVSELSEIIGLVD